jgi:hypothetical protein
MAGSGKREEKLKAENQEIETTNCGWTVFFVAASFQLSALSFQLFRFRFLLCRLD